jgi:parallel beta-helix repeat protein
LIENNIVFGNGGKCIQLFGSQNVWVIGNVCYGNSTDINYINSRTRGEITGWSTPDTLPLKNIHIQDNIVYPLPYINNTYFPDIGENDLTLQNNLFFWGIFSDLASSKGSKK